MWKCSLFGCDWRLLGSYLVVEYGQHGLENIQVRIPAVCRRCAKVRLKNPEGSYRVTWSHSEVMSREKALAIAQERARKEAGDAGT